MRRAFLLTLALPLALLLFFNVRWALATLYSRVGFHSFNEPAHAEAAHGVAARLAPWRSSSHIWTARSLMYRTDAADPVHIKAHFLNALSWSPGDPYVWTDYAQILGSLGQFDEETELATSRINRLAPASPTLQATNAAFGLRHWYRGSPRLQREWLHSMGFELRYRPRAYLRRIAASGDAYWFCASAGLDLPVKPWCDHLWKSYEIGLVPLPVSFQP